MLSEFGLVCGYDRVLKKPYQIPENSTFCNICGSKISGVNEEKNKKHSNVSIIIGVCIIGVIILISVVGLLLLGNPVKQFKDKMQKNNYTEAMKIYDNKIKGNSEKEDLIKDSLKKETDAILEDFKQNINTYREAGDRLDIILKTNLINLNVDSIKESINKLNDSRTAYKSGTEFAVEKNYGKAIIEFKKVIEDDSDYQNAQQQIKALSDQYKEDILNTVEDKASSEDFEGATSILSKALEILPNDDDLKSKQTVYTSKFEEKREAERKLKAQEAKNQQILVVQSAGIAVQSKEYKALYPDLLQVIVKNNSDQTVKDMKVSCIGFDKNGYPVKIRSQFDFQGGFYEIIGNAEDINIISGGIFGEKQGWALDESHGITYVLACVKEATFYNGDSWVNPYYSYWIEEYCEKPLPEDLK